jgi:TolA-binding protein
MTADGPLCQHRPSLFPGDAYRDIRASSGRRFHPEVLEVLDRQSRQSSAQADEVRSQIQQASASITSEIEAMKKEMYRLQKESENARQAKLQMEQEMLAMDSQPAAMPPSQISPPSQAGSNYNIQDSAIGGDMNMGATHNITTHNDPEAIARAAIEAYRMAMQDK